jgi:hypothetical protein
MIQTGEEEDMITLFERSILDVSVGNLMRQSLKDGFAFHCWTLRNTCIGREV